MVLYQGQVVERGAPVQSVHHAAHPYTRALVAVPRCPGPRAGPAPVQGKPVQAGF